MENEEKLLENARKWIQGAAHSHTNHDIQHISLESLQIVQARRGWMLFNLILHERLADRNGNCHLGAIATILDSVGALVASASTGSLSASIDLNISYFSTVKIKEEVKIGAKVEARRGKLSLVIIELKRKDGVVVALGKQWVTQVITAPRFQSKL